MLTDREWWDLFTNDWPQLQRIIDIEYKNGVRACYKCFSMHSITSGCNNEIPDHWMAL